MKIIVQGNLVDTESIVKISPIYSNGELFHNYSAYFGFIVSVINQNDITVLIREYVKDIPKELIDLHAAITKIWTDNKSDIPTFNLSSYGEPLKIDPNAGWSYDD